MITEVMANPEDEGTGEFVELYNPGATAVELAGLVLSDGDSDDVLRDYLGGATALDPGGYAVILDPDFAGQYTIPPAAVLVTVEGNATLGNALSTNDPITVRDGAGALLATYAHPFDPGNGRSAEIVEIDAGDTAENWVGAPCPAAPFASPGGLNCAAGGGANPVALTLVINEVLANALDEDTGELVELYNYGTAEVDTVGLILDDGDASDALVPMPGESSRVPPGGYAVVLDPEYAGEYSLPDAAVLLRPVDATIGSGLATTDPITLFADDGVSVISTFHHPFNPGNGISVERIDDRGDVATNWVASPCPSGSSPGRANCASPGAPEPPPTTVPALVINEVMANALDESTQEFVEIFNIGWRTGSRRTARPTGTTTSTAGPRRPPPEAGSATTTSSRSRVSSTCTAATGRL